MDFHPTQDQAEIRNLTEKVCAGFGDDYWLEQDRSAVFPHDFYDAIAKAGLLGVAMPEEYGGAGLGIAAAATMMRAVAQSGAGMAGASSIHMNIFGLQPVVAFGTPEQKQRMLPPLIRGEEKACFAVTEPDAGLNTTELKVKAERKGDRYVISGQKIWISTAQVADRALILARTTPLDKIKKKTDGLSLFYTKLDRSKIEVRLIHKMGRHAVDSNMLFFDDLEVPVEDRIGAENDGFKLILHGLNPERILIASEAVGIGHAALKRACDYANQRVVFGRTIGMNQGIQHPLARCWMNLEAADLMVKKAAWLYDSGAECGAEANTAKYLAAEAAFGACETAIQTHGGMGYSAEYHVERYLRESLIPRIAPVSPQMIMNFIAEKVLGLQKSY
ncbi:acyl-CoA dehydrogenase family protein [Ferrovibrio sp.]|uniref:acyl-CoA dehydrogenase family protein n=1 Tax=Ferrovibrio sp. TaxID=1917215 RepID=UPI003D0A0785